MFRGFTQFVCDDCGHKFTGPDMEWMCTAYPAPVKCPKCGSLNTRISGLLLFDLFKGGCKEFIRNLWKKQKKVNKTTK